MGHVNPPMVLGVLGTIEAALSSMGQRPQRSGVAAAAAAIGGDAPLEAHPARASAASGV